MGKMRTVRQPVVAHLPGLDRLDVDLFTIRLRSMQRAAPGEVSAVRVEGVGEVILHRDGGIVRARVDGKPISIESLSDRVLKPRVQGKRLKKKSA